ncbi:MAG TPA: DinB family protein [Acidimicrobiales bacterium]
MADTKNWTWVLERPCPECGFDAGVLPSDEIGAATRAVIERFGELLVAGDHVRERPRPEVWSALEYGAHVRDVFAVMATRLRLMVDEDEPVFPNWDQDATADAERYGEQDPAQVRRDLLANGESLARAFDAVGDRQWDRRGLRSDGSVFTVASLGRYMVHDPVHHVWDVEQGFALLRSSRR